MVTCLLLFYQQLGCRETNFAQFLRRKSHSSNVKTVRCCIKSLWSLKALHRVWIQSALWGLNRPSLDHNCNVLTKYNKSGVNYELSTYKWLEKAFMEFGFND